MTAYTPEELAVTLFEESGDALFLFDPDTEQLLDVNPVAQRLSGFTRQELLRMQITYLFRSEIQGGLQRLRQAYKKTGVFHSQEGFWLRCQHDRHWIPVNLTITRLHAEPKTLGLVTARDVREQREMFARLKQTEAELRRVLSSVSDHVWSAEVNQEKGWDYRYFSPVVERITGRAPDFYLLGPERWLSIVHTEDRPRMERLLLQLKAGDALVAEEEYRILRPDGDIRWVRDSVRVSKESGGQSIHIDGVVTDITERKRAEEDRSKADSQFRLLWEQSADGMRLTDAHGTILMVNDAFCRMVEMGREELQKRPFSAIYTPAEQERILRRYQESFADRRIESVLRREVTLWNGKTLWVELSNSFLDMPGQPPLLLSIYRDITERKRAEESIRASEAKYRSLIENLEQSIFLKDRELRYVAANRYHCQHLGLSESEIVGKTDYDFSPTHLADRYRGEDLIVLTEGKRLELEEHGGDNGQRRTVRVIKTPVRDGRGEIAGVLGICWDVTEQRVLEAQLRQAQKMEAVGQLAGGVAHDFNNLLTVILGNVSLLQAGVTPQDPNGELLEATEKAAMRAAELTSKMLGFSRRTTLRLEAGNLNDSIQETVALLRRTIDPRIHLDLNTSADLWTVQADLGQINQVLMNLCLNARDALPDGGRLILKTENVVLDDSAVRRHLEARSGEFVCLSVQDTGQGIPADVLPRIFEPFFTTKGPGKGTGLGLAMVFGIIKQHQGWVTCQSEVGEGTRFDIYLPRYCPARQNRPGSVVTRSPCHGNETILLADDESMIRNLGRTILQSYGYRVLLAADGAEAVNVYQKHREQIDLVILDLTMPRLSGRDALRQLLQIDPAVHVLIATGHSIDEDLATEKNDGILGFISKPYRPEELARTVRNTLNNLHASMQ